MNVAMETYAITSSAYTLPTNKLIYHPLKNVTDNFEISSLNYNLEFLYNLKGKAKLWCHYVTNEFWGPKQYIISISFLYTVMVKSKK